MQLGTLVSPLPMESYCLLLDLAVIIQVQVQVQVRACVRACVCDALWNTHVHNHFYISCTVEHQN